MGIMLSHIHIAVLWGATVPVCQSTMLNGGWIKRTSPYCLRSCVVEGMSLDDQLNTSMLSLLLISNEKSVLAIVSDVMAAISSSHDQVEDEEKYVLLDLDGVSGQVHIPPNAPYVLSGLDTLNPILVIDNKVKLVSQKLGKVLPEATSSQGSESSGRLHQILKFRLLPESDIEDITAEPLHRLVYLIDHRNLRPISITLMSLIYGMKYSSASAASAYLNSTSKL
ncbi:hypothetical protein C3L33_12528, partial [Rhododendron williamsianum]